MVGKRRTSGLQRSCPGGTRRPGTGRGGSASCPTLEARDTNRPLGLPSVKWEGWAGPARSLNASRLSNPMWSSPGGGGVGTWEAAPVSRGVPQAQAQGSAQAQTQAKLRRASGRHVPMNGAAPSCGDSMWLVPPSALGNKSAGLTSVHTCHFGSVHSAAGQGLILLVFILWAEAWPC